VAKTTQKYPEKPTSCAPAVSGTNKSEGAKHRETKEEKGKCQVKHATVTAKINGGLRR